MWSLGAHQRLHFIEISPSVGAINHWLVIASSDEVTFLDIFKSWANDLQLSYVISWTFQQPFSCACTLQKGLDKHCSEWSYDQAIRTTWELIRNTKSWVPDNLLNQCLCGWSPRILRFNQSSRWFFLCCSLRTTDFDCYFCLRTHMSFLYVFFASWQHIPTCKQLQSRVNYFFAGSINFSICQLTS